MQDSSKQSMPKSSLKNLFSSYIMQQIDKMTMFSCTSWVQLLAVGSSQLFYHSILSYLNCIFLKKGIMPWSYCWTLFASNLYLYLLKFMLIHLFSIFLSKYVIFETFTWKSLIAPFFSLHGQFFFHNTCNKFQLPSVWNGNKYIKQR